MSDWILIARPAHAGELIPDVLPAHSILDVLPAVEVLDVLASPKRSFLIRVIAGTWWLIGSVSEWLPASSWAISAA